MKFVAVKAHAYWKKGKFKTKYIIFIYHFYNKVFLKYLGMWYCPKKIGAFKVVVTLLWAFDYNNCDVSP